MTDNIFCFNWEAWKRNWYFTQEERHALLLALERHYQSLIEVAPDWEILHLESIEAIAEIIGWTSIMAPAGQHDVFIFSFLVAEELNFLQNLPDDFEFENCDCHVSEHMLALQEWRDKNMR